LLAPKYDISEDEFSTQQQNAMAPGLESNPIK
jgi:hypothetical protein